MESRIITICGFFVAVGSIFLNIPVFGETNSLDSLNSLKFAWLLLIFFSLVPVFIYAGFHIYKLERKFEKKTNFELIFSFSYFFGLIALYILYNLGKYIYFLYGSFFEDIRPFIFGAFIFLPAALFFYIKQKIKSKTNKFIFRQLLLFGLVIFCSILTYLFSIILTNSFNLHNLTSEILPVILFYYTIANISEIFFFFKK